MDNGLADSGQGFITKGFRIALYRLAQRVWRRELVDEAKREGCRRAQQGAAAEIL